jgi:K(+)-stimulated pyrophosphate-energized sodium pump
VTELGLILGINLAGLCFAALLARWLLARDAGTAEMRRLTSAVERATTAFLRGEYRFVAIVAAGLATLVFALHGHLARPGSLVTPLEAGFWTALALLLGAAAVCVTALVGAELAARGSVRTVAGARLSLDRALSIAVRAGGVAGLVAETLSVLSLSALFVLVFAMKGGLHLAAPQAADLALQVALLLPGFGLGAAAAALVLQRGGATFHVSGDVGGDLAGERDAGLDHDDTRNPAIVADLVGDYVGLAATRTIDLFLSATAANVTVIVVGACIYQEHHAELAGVTALIGLPLVVRAFGVIASGFGVMVVRSDEQRNPAAGLWRGHFTTAVVALGGLFGATIWLLGAHYWARFFAAGALGLVAVSLSAHATRYRVERRFAPLREVLDALRVGDAATVAQGLAAGLGSVALPALLIGGAMTGAWELGVSSGLQSGGVIGALTALMAMLASGPFVLAVAAFGSITDNAQGVAAMNAAVTHGETQRRASRLDDAGFAGAAMAQTYLIVVGCLSALLAAAALPLMAQRLSVWAAPSEIAKPVIVWSGALGAVAVLGYAGSVVRAAMRGARGVALEVERQLRGFPRERGLAIVPRDYTPSYRSLIDLVSKSALERLLWPSTAALLLPVAIGIVLSVAYRHAAPGVAAEALTAFVIAGAVTALGAALAIDGARATLGAARRAAGPRGGTSDFGASLSGDAFADLLGNAAAPAAELIVKAAALTSLALLPFLT